MSSRDKIEIPISGDDREFQAAMKRAKGTADRFHQPVEKAATAINGLGSAFSGLQGPIGAAAGAGANMLAVVKDVGIGAGVAAGGIAILSGAVNHATDAYNKYRRASTEALKKTKSLYEEIVKANNELRTNISLIGNKYASEIKKIETAEKKVYEAMRQRTEAQKQLADLQRTGVVFAGEQDPTMRTKDAVQQGEPLQVVYANKLRAANAQEAVEKWNTALKAISAARAQVELIKEEEAKTTAEKIRQNKEAEKAKLEEQQRAKARAAAARAAKEEAAANKKIADFAEQLRDYQEKAKAAQNEADRADREVIAQAAFEEFEKAKKKAADDEKKQLEEIARQHDQVRQAMVNRYLTEAELMAQLAPERKEEIERLREMALEQETAHETTMRQIAEETEARQQAIQVQYEGRRLLADIGKKTAQDLAMAAYDYGEQALEIEGQIIAARKAGNSSLVSELRDQQSRLLKDRLTGFMRAIGRELFYEGLLQSLKGAASALTSPNPAQKTQALAGAAIGVSMMGIGASIGGIGALVSGLGGSGSSTGSGSSATTGTGSLAGQKISGEIELAGIAGSGPAMLKGELSGQIGETDIDGSTAAAALSPYASDDDSGLSGPGISIEERAPTVYHIHIGTYVGGNPEQSMRELSDLVREGDRLQGRRP